MGGGPSPEQSAAAASQASLNSQLGSAASQAQKFQQKQQEAANPFYMSRMTNGLPYVDALTDSQSGTNAQAFAPARANLIRSLGNQNLPSGFQTQALTDLSSAQARSFDQDRIGALGANEQAKQAGASGILGQAQLANPQSYFGLATQGNNAIMQAPLQRPGIGGLLGGIAGGAASAIPF